MVKLQKIKITHFKNYDFSEFDFTERIVGICGLNGVGKTNLIDAIYYSCFTKSYFSKTDILNIGFGKSGFRIESHFLLDEKPQKVICIHRGGNSKEFSLNDEPYKKLSKHVGVLPAVMIAPDDISIIIGKSEYRRKYIDAIFSQIDQQYLESLIRYNKLITQRNSLLKQFAEQRKNDLVLLDVIDQQIFEVGDYIYQFRKKGLAELIPLIEDFYFQLSQSEKIKINYQSSLNNQTFAILFKENLQKDLILQRTNIGIHKDDLDVLLNEFQFKQIASQGQRKTLLFAMKMAEYKLLFKHKKTAPLLLLDDVFEKLDELRMHQLLEWVHFGFDGQVFITDTHQERLKNALDKLNLDYQIIGI